MSSSHLGLMLLFAACVSAVFGTLLREGAAQQVRFAARAFAGLAGGAYALGWIMYWFFR